MTPRTQTDPEIQWDGTTWHLTLPVEHGNVIGATWKPGLTYVIRIREAGSEHWSFGFETPTRPAPSSI